MKRIPHFSICLGVMMLFSVSAFSQSILENTQFRLFTHAELSSAKDSAGTRNNAMQIGDVEMLITSQISDKISFLGEVIYTSDNGIEIDRLMIKYQFNDHFHLSAGRLYTPLGLWNTTFYHHARVLTPTIDHPVMIADHSDFGVLDNKDTGIQFAGENISNFRLGYKLFLSDGYTADFGKKNQGQSVTYNLFAEPVDNFKFGVSGQYQKINAGTAMASSILKETHYLNLLNASVMYLGGTSNFEFASEYFIANARTASSKTDSFSGFFIYGGYKVGKFVPYVMYNKIDYQRAWEVFPKNNFTGSTLGVRYKISPMAVLKLEAQFLKADDFKKLNRIEIMWAIGF
jgi:hypothetical protein